MDGETTQCVNLSTEAPNDFSAREQFRLLDLFVLLSASAIAFSIGAPFLRELNATQWYWLLTLTTVQLGSISLAFYFLTLRHKSRLEKRQQMLASAGNFLGASEFDQANMEMVKRGSRWFDFIYLILLQSMLVWTTAVGAKIGIPTLVYMSSLVPCLIITFGFIAHWVGIDMRRMGERIEFFEEGISIDGVALIPWERVSIRPRKLQETGIAIVYGDLRGFENTVFADCSDATRNRLLERPV